jgi:hypothetical protein
MVDDRPLHGYRNACKTTCVSRSCLTPSVNLSYAAILQVIPRLVNELKERSPKVWNS